MNADIGRRNDPEREVDPAVQRAQPEVVNQLARMRRGYLPVAGMHLKMAESDYAALGGPVSGAPGVNAGTAGLAATQATSDIWFATGAAGVVLLAGTGAFGLRRRLSNR